MDFSVFRNFQFGMDIATSLTIIGAAYSWYRNQKKAKQEEERLRQLELQRGINDSTRAVVTEGIQNIIRELSATFNRIATSGLSIEAGVKTLFQRGGFEWIYEAVSKGALELDEYQAKLTTFKDHVYAFYDATAASRYLLFPALYSLPEGEEAIGALKENFRSIANAHRRFSLGPITVLMELEALLAKKAASEPYAEDPHELRKQVVQFHEDNMDSIGAILLSAECAPFMSDILPKKDRDTYLAFLKGRDRTMELTDAEQLLYGEAVLLFTTVLLKDPTILVAAALSFAANEVTAVRDTCKQTLINLAAVSCRILSKDSGQSIPGIAAELQTEKYFNLANEVR